MGFFFPQDLSLLVAYLKNDIDSKGKGGYNAQTGIVSYETFDVQPAQCQMHTLGADRYNVQSIHRHIMLSGKPSVLLRLQLVHIWGANCTHQHMVPTVAKTFAVVPLPMIHSDAG